MRERDVETEREKRNEAVLPPATRATLNVEPFRNTSSTSQPPYRLPPLSPIDIYTELAAYALLMLRRPGSRPVRRVLFSFFFFATDEHRAAFLIYCSFLCALHLLVFVVLVEPFIYSFSAVSARKINICALSHADGRVKVSLAVGN